MNEHPTRQSTRRLGMFVGCTMMLAWTAGTVATADNKRIQPYLENPFYWQYKGEPALLLGGSWQDNLFNHPIGLAEHLDLLVASGGNYVRNTMSHRNQGNVFAYKQLAGPGIPLEEDGKFDLNQFNEDYWLRPNDFLRMTHERDIIVQIEIFDPHDHFRDHQSLGGWSKHPFNPANNVNYERTLFVRQYISENPRPINSVKLYNTAGGEESVARMFGFIFAGGSATESGKPDETTTVAFGLNQVPSRDHEAEQAIADQFQLDFFTTIIQWKEPEPGAYFWKEFPEEDPFGKHLQGLKRKGFLVSLTNTTVHMDQKHLPKYLAGKRFDDPEMLERWAAFLRSFLARYGDHIDFLNLGNEVGSYFGGHQDEWSQYLAFVRKGAEIIHQVRPEIRVGVVLSCNDAAHYWPELEPYCDYLAFTYYTPNSALTKSPTANALDPQHPHYFAAALDSMLRLAGDKPVLITEIGCATHESIDSSPEIQARFIRQLIAWLPGKEDRILGVSWLSHIDWPYAHTKQALQGYLDEKLLENEPFMRYLTTLGLMYEDGTKKPGYAALRSSLERYRRGELPIRPLTESQPPATKLSNGGFESGDLSEEANNVIGPKSWMTSDEGGNTITVTEKRARSGSHSLRWHPIGWNKKDDQTIEDASTFIITRVAARPDSSAIVASLSGAVDTSTLDPKFQVLVILANSSFTKVSADTVLRGGVSEWQPFDASLELGAEGDTLFVAFMVNGSKGVGAGDGSVYLDDLRLTCSSLKQSGIRN